MTCGYCGERITEDQFYWNEWRICDVCDDTFHSGECIEQHEKDNPKCQIK
jgi:hypothetical protein